MFEYKGVIFDLDGTLIDSMGIWERIDVEFLSKRNITVPNDYMEAIAHLSAYDTAVYTIDRFKLADTPEELVQEWIDMALEKYCEAKLKPGVEKYIQFLVENNKKIAIATATESRILEAALKDKKIKNHIHTIVTVSEVSRGKSHPDIYLKCASKMNLLPDECIVFEDLLTAVSAAKQGGFYTVAVYDKYSEGTCEQIKEVCDKYICSFEEMIK